MKLVDVQFILIFSEIILHKRLFCFYTLSKFTLLRFSKLWARKCFSHFSTFSHDVNSRWVFKMSQKSTKYSCQKISRLFRFSWKSMQFQWERAFEDNVANCKVEKIFWETTENEKGRKDRGKVRWMHYSKKKTIFYPRRRNENSVLIVLSELLLLAVLWWCLLCRKTFPFEFFHWASGVVHLRTMFKVQRRIWGEENLRKIYLRCDEVIFLFGISSAPKIFSDS